MALTGREERGGEAVKHVNGVVWSLAPAVWHSSELAGARGKSPRPRAPFVPGLGYVKGGGRGKISRILGTCPFIRAPAASRCDNGGGHCGLGPGRFRNENGNSACSGWDKQIPLLAACKAVQPLASQTPSCLGCCHRVVPPPPNCHLQPPSRQFPFSSSAKMVLCQNGSLAHS